MASDSPIQVDDVSSLSSLETSYNNSPVIERPVHNAFVALPSLTTEQKLLYKPLSKSSLGLNFEAQVDEVIGEYCEGKTLYYFARYDGGIARKYLASTFASKYGRLVVEYKKKKMEGLLAPFDPSAQYVHPLARLKMKTKISSDQRTRGWSSATGDSIPDSETADSTEEDDQDDDFEEGYKLKRFQPKRPSRPAPKDLPFSPRKTRARKVLTIPDSDSHPSDDDLDGFPVLRRSTRARKATEILLDSDADYVYDAQLSPRRLKLKLLGPKLLSQRPVIPLYGRVRNIKTLLEDPFDDDDDNAVLRRHHQMCEKCHEGPAHEQLRAFKMKPKNKGKKRKRSSEDEFEYTDDEDRFQRQGGWVHCLKCPVVAHWGCLASSQQDDILRAIREKDLEDLTRQPDFQAADALPRKRSGLNVDQMTEFVCVSCTRGGTCMGCMESAFCKVEDGVPPEALKDDDIIMEDVSQAASRPSSVARELLFRCFTCKRPAHYHHLPRPLHFEDASIAEIAEHYQITKSWLCADCSSYRYGLDKIIAWRPYPADAIEPVRKPGQLPIFKSGLPREYLVKWSERSYRRLDWVPHMWLLSTNPSKLKNFIVGGTKVELLEEPVREGQDDMELDHASTLPTFEKVTESRASSIQPDSNKRTPSEPMPDAERRIPSTWKTVHRVLDVLLWRRFDKKGLSKRKRTKTIESSEEGNHPYAVERRITFEKGEQPSSNSTQLVDDWEKHKKLDADDIDVVAWAFIKWDELGYEEATWDAPPRPGEFGYEAFKAAFKKFLESRAVFLPRCSEEDFEAFDRRPRDGYRERILKDPAKLELGQPKNLKLMPFQVDGFNWLCNNWWNHQPCILADEMGLGKTIQMVSFLGTIKENWNAFPSLVVVPNSTVTNWVREFERWAPKLRVVPFYGEKRARDVIKNFELFHESPPSGSLKTKFHVLVTTYDAITNSKDTAAIFKGQPRWEVLVVDEGQRLKSDSSILFRKLSELNSRHRAIMTGTPLNNNMRELFNLMNFLDPEGWQDLEVLEKQYEHLNEDLIKDLHNRLRPYFLRRIKSEVLELPPKNEVIVPVTMTPLQREVYRSILSNNLEILQGLTQSIRQNNLGKSRINNVLMQLRKCLQHPYLYAQDLEPKDLAPRETHEKLIDASAKLRFLKSLLSKLKERGNRVLLFSQFVIALNVIEDFLVGEGYKFLRFDGNTKGPARQKAMDDFNKPGSEYFIFLLSTRAGGVGINLYTADTVIIFDPDFNPHQDLQAIARAYRYGQQKTCLVFKLMVKDSAEERIVQIGRKKLVLDHLIVQKMDDDEENGGENVTSILTYGAQALITPDQSFRDITYTEQDIEKLIEKTQKEAVQEVPKAGGGGLTFTFAKVWAADKDGLDEVVDDDQTDSWARALEKLNKERTKEHEMQTTESGRGARRRAADVAKTKMKDSSRAITDSREKSRSPSEFSVTGLESDQDALDEDFEDIPETTRDTPQIPLNSIQDNIPSRDCGLCGRRHRDGECAMIEDSENLVEYRETLIRHADDEPWEERLAAVNAIDELLAARNQTHLIVGQPLQPLVKQIPGPPPKKLNNPFEQSKRTLSTSQAQKVKRPRAVPPCILCHSPTPHYYKDCSVVKEGSRSIGKAIQLLESQKDSSLTNVIGTLRSLLAKAKTRERANETANVAGPTMTSTS